MSPGFSDRLKGIFAVLTEEREKISRYLTEENPTFSLQRNPNF